MKTIIDLKLNLKNLSGVLENGNRYRVFFKNEFIRSLNKYQLHLVVKEEVPEFLGIWIYNEDLSIFNWYEGNNYKECLRNTLFQLEEKLNVQLLKSTMSIAV